LFSLIPRLKGDHLVDYVGECLNASELEQRYPKENVGIFALALSSSCFIDAALFRGVGAYANASRFDVKPNVRFVVNPRTRSARLEVTRRIEAGGEIFVSYGSDYWKFAHLTTHNTSNVPVWEWDTSDPFAVPAVTTACPAEVSGEPVLALNVANTCLDAERSLCLSPGPNYDGPLPDPESITWPFSEFPDWPISDTWRDFAFDPVVLRARFHESV